MTSSIGVLPLMRWLETTGQNPTTAAGVTLKSRTECLQVHQVDAVRLQPPQGLLDSNADELRVVSELTAAIGPDIVAKLGGQEDLPGLSVQGHVRSKVRVSWWTHVVPLAGPLEPLPEQVLAVAVQGGRVPVPAPELVCAVEELEAFLVGRGRSVKGWKKC